MISGNGKSVQTSKLFGYVAMHLYVYRLPLKYSNRTYTCTQNIQTEQPLPILGKWRLDN